MGLLTLIQTVSNDVCDARILAQYVDLKITFL